MNPRIVESDPAVGVRKLLEGHWRVADLVRFHAAHKLLLLAHSPEAYRQLGRLVADARARPPDEIARRYREMFAAALEVAPSRGRHVNVLQHIAGCLKDHLDPESKTELLAAIEAYRRSVIPLGVPVALLRQQARVHAVDYVARQAYLECWSHGV